MGANGENPEILVRSPDRCGGSKREKGLEAQEVTSRRGALETGILEDGRNGGQRRRRRREGHWIVTGDAADIVVTHVIQERKGVNRWLKPFLKSE